MKPSRAAAAAVRQRRMRGRGRFTAEDVRKLYIAQSARCVSCTRHLAITGYHVDHIISIAKGGLNVVANLQLLCPLCNLRKGKK
jgi:5-methylcytosine-specific restriction endonuclease McrA